MLTIISGTNRKDSKTRAVAKIAQVLAENKGIAHQIIDLSEIPTDFIHSEQYNGDNLPDWLKELQDSALIPAKHFLIVSPEYNGSIPGFLKLFIDAISVHRFKECFAGKHTALVGVASGRAGNLRGNDHLSSILHHIGCNVVPGALPISNIGTVMNDVGQLDESTTKALEAVIEKLVA